MHHQSGVNGGLLFYESRKCTSHHCAHEIVSGCCVYIFQQRLSAYQIVHYASFSSKHFCHSDEVLILTYQ